MGRVENNWQDNEFIHERFGKNMKQARLSYWRFVEQGISLGRQPQLAGGGLVRSVGGWSEIKALRRIGHKQKGDERILGDGEFVSYILSEAELATKNRLANLDRGKAASELVERSCRERGILIQALSGGSRLAQVSAVRQDPAYRLTSELGLRLAEAARLLGVSTSAVARILMRINNKKSN
jgi:hypothetical protein